MTNVTNSTTNTSVSKSVSTARKVAQIGMLAAIATVLMLFEIPLPFAPSFYELDFSEVPILIGCFAMGPAAGACIELIKILLNFIINGTMTAGVGEIANLLIGCSFVIPAGIIYRKMHSKKGALIGMVTGTLFMTFVGCFLNAYILLPTYAKAFEMPIDALVGMGTAVNAHITSLFTFVAFAVAPFNLLKGILVSFIVLLVYKKISPILHNA
ncbi:MAG: ECF transporter S component [Lachnospiraceae bacterium]